MRRFFRRRAPEIAIAALVTLLIATLLLSSRLNVGAFDSASARSERLLDSTGEIVLGCEWYDRGYPQYFRSGVRMAEREINEGLAGNSTKGVAMPSGEARPLRVVFKQALPFDRLYQTDPVAQAFTIDRNVAAVIDNLPDEWIGRAKAVYESAGILSVSTAASFPGVNRSLHYSISTAVHDDELAKEITKRTPELLRATLNMRAQGAALLSTIDITGPAWTAGVCEAEAAQEQTRERMLAMLRLAVARGRVDPDVPLNKLRDEFSVPSSFWSDVSQAVANAQARFGEGVTARQVLEAHARDVAPAPFRVVEEYYPDQTDLFAQLSAIRSSGADYLIIDDNTTSRVLRVIREVRRLQMMLPVVVSDNHQFERYAQQLGAESGDVFTFIDQDPNYSTPRLRAFRDRYVEFLRSQGEQVHEPGFMSLQGYEAVYLLKSVYESIGGIEPLNATSALRHRGSAWPGKAIDGYKLSTFGDVKNARWYPLWLHNGKIQEVHLPERDKSS